MPYKYKYIKYKTKYLNLKKKMNTKLYNFYFIHSTTIFQNLLDILRTGILFPGKYLTLEQRKLYGEEPSDYVYANIYFEDIKNIEYTLDYTLILHPKIMDVDGFFFNIGWQKFPLKKSEILAIESSNNSTIKYPQTGIEISANDSPEIVNQKLKEIHDFLKNLKLPEILLSSPGIMHHEILFDHPINLSNSNLIGIICNYCDSSTWDWETHTKLIKPSDEQLRLIKEAIKDKPYAHVKIFTRNTPMPKLNKLI